MKEFLYNIVYSLFYLVSLLPYKALYAISDFAYIIVYHVARYRRGTVRKNITSAFPEKTQEECADIEKGFYRWLCDYFMETLKLMSVKREKLLSHIEFRGIEQIEERFDRGQECAAYLGHYANWEYLSATGQTFKKHHEAVCGLIYHPLRNKMFDRLFIKIRQNMGGVCIPKKDILRYLVSYRRQKLMNICGYIADQAPKYKNIHLWLPFLNHDTPVFTGAERLIRKMNNAVFYAEIERVERGKYVCTYKLMTDNPAEMDEFELTKKYFALLEQTIRREPRCYLWSHDRWKRTHEDFNKRYIIENGHVLVKKDNARNDNGKTETKEH